MFISNCIILFIYLKRMLSCKLKHHVPRKRYYPVSLSCYSTKPTQNVEVLPPKKVTFKDKFKETWNGPNFKYWFIGTTAFLSWMAYYGTKTYKKTRIDIEILPPLPRHARVKRESEVQELCRKYEALSGLLKPKKIKKLSVHGPSAIGKTMLVHEFLQHLQNKQQNSIFSFPKSHVTVFIQCDAEDSFLTSLKAFAAKLKIKPSQLQELMTDADVSFATAPFETQCDALLQCIQDALQKHSKWVMVFDNMLSSSSKTIFDVINKWFGDDNKEWSAGTTVMIHDGSVNNLLQLKEENCYAIQKSLTLEDGCQLIQQVANLDQTVATSDSIKHLLDFVTLNPLAVVCVGVLLKENLSRKETISIEKAANEVCESVESNIKGVISANQHLHDFIATPSGMTLVTIETVVAMVMKSMLDNDQYLYHGFDFMSTLKPGDALPQSVLTRFLRMPYYMLPPLVQASGGMSEYFSKQKSDLEAVKNKVDEFEPKGKAWSNKNLAEYIRKAEDLFITGVNTVKDIYNLVYGELPALPEKPDGLDMFRKCDLLCTSVLEPGSVKSVSMHPLVYNVARQHFASSSIYRREAEHLLESQTKYNNFPWYKRFNAFDEQTVLQKHRLASGHVINQANNVPAETYLFRYNLGIDVSPVFFTSPYSNRKEEFWLPKSEDKLKYLQDHISRVVTALCEEIDLSKENVEGRSVKRYLLTHLEYIVNNQPKELIHTPQYTQGLQTMAKCYFDLYKDYTRSQHVLEHVLQLQKISATVNQLDMAKTMGKLADIHNSFGEYEKSKSLLLDAVEIYEADRRKCGEYKRCLEFGKLLGLLGIVYAALNLKSESKETIERSLMLKQAVPPDLADEAKSKDFGSDFASSLTDLGHSYVSMGMPLYGKKILDLALSAHRNLHGENHPEVVRTLTVLAVAHLMQGNNAESKRLRNEAGKLQSLLNGLPVY